MYLLVAQFLDILGNARVCYCLLYASACERLGRNALYSHGIFLVRPVRGHPGQGGGGEEGPVDD